MVNENMSNAELSNACASNNRGANLIDEGDYLGAISHLSYALKCTKDCFVKSILDDEQEVPFDLDFLMAKSRGASHESGNDDAYFVYAHAIQIPEALMIFSNPSSHFKTVCAAISIFNLALAHHLHALTTPHNSDAFLIKAAQLYKFSTQVQGEIRRTALCSFFYRLVIVNNLADVQRRLGNDRKSMKICEELLQMLMFYSEYRNEMSKDEPTTLQAFYQNSVLYLLSAGSVNAAPAA